MPNIVKNVWKIKNIPQEYRECVLHKLCTVNPSTDESIIDFDLIIPQPRFKQDCPKEYRVKSAKEASIQEDKDRPWFNWYNWNIDNWGTKWNAYDGYTMLNEKTSLTLVFSTAWSFPDPIAEALTKFNILKECNLEFRYADEAIGMNCGVFTYSPKAGTWKLTAEEHLLNAKKFAENLWKEY